MPFASLIAVALGGAIGSLARHGVNLLALGIMGPSFPWGTMAVNVVGSLLMGVLTGLFVHVAPPAPALRLFLTTGVMGGFTTFSAFSLDAALMMERGSWGEAAFYGIGSVALSLAALFAGLWLVRSFAG